MTTTKTLTTTLRTKKTSSKTKVTTLKTASRTYRTVETEIGGVDYKFRSPFEHKVALNLSERGCTFKHEPYNIKYSVPVQKKNYLPDFEITKSNGEPLFVEVKGRFDSKDRQKMKHLKASNPNVDVRFLFWSATKKINPKSTTTYADWCKQYGFQFAEKVVPEAWLKE